jgi:hypothetical protein
MDASVWTALIVGAVAGGGGMWLVGRFIRGCLDYIIAGINKEKDKEV